MKEFYRKFNILNLEKIQDELISCIKHDFISNKKTHSWIYPTEEVFGKCPSLVSFLQPRLKKPIFQIKYYCTAPKSSLGYHVDGSTLGSGIVIPFGMNIPLLNATENYQCWFDCPPENTICRTLNDDIRDKSGYLMDVDVPKDPNSMQMLQKMELNCPALTKTDIMHCVFNPTEKTRLIVVFRWNLLKVDYSEPEEVIHLEDLYV